MSRFAGLRSIAEGTGDFTVEVSGANDLPPAVILTEKNAFGETAVTFTPEEAREIALFLLRAANALEPDDIPLRLAASE